jgi:hypothetical protein
MANTRKPALRSVLAQDGTLVALDAAEFKDASGGCSLSEVYAASPELRKMVEDAEAERRRVQDCRFGKTSADAGATVQTTRRKSTYAGYR